MHNRLGVGEVQHVAEARLETQQFVIDGNRGRVIGQVDGGFLPNGPASIWISMAVVMFSFGGVEMISLSAAEAKDPARSVATSVKAMIWRLSTFYVVSMAIILCLVPWQTAAQNSELTESPFVLVFSELGIPFDVIGDSVKARMAIDATAEAYKVGMAL